jgi:hypothetical protein
MQHNVCDGHKVVLLSHVPAQNVQITYVCICVLLTLSCYIMTQRSSQHIKHINLCFFFSGTILSFEPKVVNYMSLKLMYCDCI